LAWLQEYAFDPAEVSLTDNEGELEISVRGSWKNTILWEVPLLAILSESYFKHADDDWNPDPGAYRERAYDKARALVLGGCHFSDFGTRRRRSLALHQAAIKGLIEGSSFTGTGAFAGTSNLMLAKQFGLTPIGTIAHEWIMAIGAMEGVMHANQRALEKWLEVYPAEKTIGLTDTYTVDLFLDDFSRDQAESIAGVRHDSGDPFFFVDRMVRKYEDLGIDSREKRFVFSDELNVEKACRIQQYAEQLCQPAFGIGTDLTNDFPGSPAQGHRGCGRNFKSESDH